MPGRSLLRALSPREFAALGRTQIAYLKRTAVRGAAAYAVHAADGTYLWQFADRELAVAALRQHELEAVSVH